ncbi:ABC transporter permease subunit [Desulfofundulus thermobenzoicus]|uniref:Transport permease protein n=1 Tax=Desulfofundulus thermobenzoicus TaxID=29376 RepID=A0A6N7IPL5_9FIRM|nr:ABC transporter permease [Desulfofundulus thermobenzoicus]MQL51543.1 ABC transporter permease subunit [Desulfofundulus thermobenzoicus]
MLTQFSFVWKREWRYIFGNHRLLAILIGIPFLYLSLFGTLYSRHVVNHIPLGVLDLEDSALSRSVINAFSDSDRFDYVLSLDSQKAMEAAMERGQIMAAVVIPGDFSTKIKRGQSSEVMVVVNGSNMIISNAVTNAANEIIQTLTAGTIMRKLEGSGLPARAAIKFVQPISLRLRVWYNPTFNYTNFLLLGLIATISQQVALLYMAVAMAREKENGTLTELQVACNSALAVVAGKIAPYYVINFVTLNLMFLVAYWIFQIPFRGHYLYLLLLLAFFLACILSLGIFLSVICKSELEATQIAMLVAVPSFLFSGYTWPLSAMPPVALFIARLLPLTYFCDNVRKIFLMEVGFPVILPDLVVLAAIAAILFPLSVLITKKYYLQKETLAISGENGNS